MTALVLVLRPVLELSIQDTPFPGSGEVSLDLLGKRWILVDEHIVFNWMLTAAGRITGVELHLSPRVGLLESHREITEFPYVSLMGAFVVVWFTPHREATPRMQNNWLSACYQSASGELMIVLDTERIFSTREFGDLAKLCGSHNEN